MSVYNRTAQHSTAQHSHIIIPERRVTFIYYENEFGRTCIDGLKHKLIRQLESPKIIAKLVEDNKNPDYVIVADSCFVSYADYTRLKKYMNNGSNRIFCFISHECLEPDMTVFDYATTWNKHHTFPGRIIHNVPYIYNRKTRQLHKNDLTRDQAIEILRERRGFCNFLYSHPSTVRDMYFHMLCAYKKVDALNWLNNTGRKPQRNSNWYDQSIEIKSNYKFSMAMENSSSSGYTSEKIITSLLAHTVPIYWGDPDVTDFINPKAFINCHDYDSFDQVIDRVKEIDNNDELYLDMITQPWQTEEQIQKTIERVENYREFIRNIFSQNPSEAKRRSEDGFPGHYYGVYWNVRRPAWLPVRAYRKLKRILHRIILPKS